MQLGVQLGAVALPVMYFAPRRKPPMEQPSDAQLVQQAAPSKTLPVREDSSEEEYRLESAISCAIEWANLGGG